MGRGAGEYNTAAISRIGRFSHKKSAEDLLQEVESIFTDNDDVIWLMKYKTLSKQARKLSDGGQQVFGEFAKRFAEHERTKKRYNEGDCSLLARELSALTGAPIVVCHSPATDASQGAHACIQVAENTFFDVNGLQSGEELKERWRDLLEVREGQKGVVLSTADENTNFDGWGEYISHRTPDEHRLAAQLLLQAHLQRNN